MTEGAEPLNAQFELLLEQRVAERTRELTQANAELQRQNEALRQSEREARQIANSIPAGIGVLAPNGELLAILQRNRVILRLDFGRHLPQLTADRVQLQQVILNLLLNATDAMSSINDRQRSAVIRTAPEADSVRLSVEDTGIGFTAEDAERLPSVLHHQEQRHGHRPVRESLDHREPRRSPVGRTQRWPGCDLLVLHPARLEGSLGPSVPLCRAMLGARYEP